MNDIVESSGPAELTKHLETKFQKVKQWAEMGYIKMEFVASKNNLADSLTKQTTDNFQQFVDAVLQLRGSGKK